jgi:ubiquitin
MPNKRYRYNEDDFVVADSEVETSSRKSARTNFGDSQDASTRRSREAPSRYVFIETNEGEVDSDRPATRSRTMKMAKLVDAPAPFSKTSKSAQKAKLGRNRTVQAQQKEALQELRDLPLWGGAMEMQRDKAILESSSLEDEMPWRHTRKAIARATPARVRKARALERNQRIDEVYRVSKKPTSSKLVHRTMSSPFGELAALKIDQNGFREWQHPLLQGNAEYQYHASIIAPTTEPPLASTIGILELPGELRNRIYRILLEDEEEVTVKKDTSAYSTVQGARRSFRKVSEKSRFQSYALAQSCKQLRSEYLPWLRQNRRIRVCLTALYDYLDVFHPAENEFEPYKRAEGHIEPIWHDFALTESFDVLPLVKIVDATPELRFTLSPSEVDVALTPYHELSIIKTIITTYPQWRHIASKIRMRSINLSSKESRVSWYGYLRLIEVGTGRAISGREDQREGFIASWIFKTGFWNREDITFKCEVADGTHWWEPMGYWGREFELGCGWTDDEVEEIEWRYWLMRDPESMLGYKDAVE